MTVTYSKLIEEQLLTNGTLDFKKITPVLKDPNSPSELIDFIALNTTQPEAHIHPNLSVNVMEELVEKTVGEHQLLSSNPLLPSYLFMKLAEKSIVNGYGMYYDQKIVWKLSEEAREHLLILLINNLPTNPQALRDLEQITRNYVLTLKTEELIYETAVAYPNSLLLRRLAENSSISEARIKELFDTNPELHQLLAMNAKTPEPIIEKLWYTTEKGSYVRDSLTIHKNTPTYLVVEGMFGEYKNVTEHSLQLMIPVARRRKDWKVALQTFLQPFYEINEDMPLEWLEKLAETVY